MKYGKKLNDGGRIFDYMNKGGKLRGYKFMAEGGETDPPKEPNYSGVQKIGMSGQMPTDERSLVELIETAQIEKNKTANKGITTGALMWTGSESGKDWMGVQGMSDEGKGIAAEYYDNLMAKAREKLRSVKGDKPSILEPGEFGRNLGGELEKGRSLEDIGETMEGKRGYKF